MEAKEGGLRSNQTFLHLDLRTPSSRILQQYIFASEPFCLQNFVTIVLAD